MCDCYNCEKITKELIEIIDKSHEYTDTNLKIHLAPYVYYKLKRYNRSQKQIEISICPDSSMYCEIFDTLQMGEGVRAINDIEPNTVIGCYLGCIKSSENTTIDWKYSFEFALNGYLIDGADKKSMMSIVNHSRKPNVEIDYHIHIVNGKKQCHIVFITNTKIRSGEELFIDYGNDYWNFANKYGIMEFNVVESSSKRQRKITDYYS